MAKVPRASLQMIRDALTHEDNKTSRRYIRRSDVKITDADLRNAKRAADNDGGTA